MRFIPNFSYVREYNYWGMSASKNENESFTGKTHQDCKIVFMGQLLQKRHSRYHQSTSQNCPIYQYKQVQMENAKTKTQMQTEIIQTRKWVIKQQNISLNLKTGNQFEQQPNNTFSVKQYISVVTLSKSINTDGQATESSTSQFTAQLKVI